LARGTIELLESQLTAADVGFSGGALGGAGEIVPPRVDDPPLRQRVGQPGSGPGDGLRSAA